MFYKCQVSGRLHVEVWRGTEADEEGSQQENSVDGETQDRKMHCVVRDQIITTTSTSGPFRLILRNVFVTDSSQPRARRDTTQGRS